MINRRTFVKGLAVGGAAAGLGMWPSRGFAQADSRMSPATLTGTEFDLRIGESPVNFTGAPRMGITVNGTIPAPLVRWREGDTVTMRVANTLPEAGAADLNNPAKICRGVNKTDSTGTREK